MTPKSRKPRDRPFLRYHGGKWRLAPWIAEHLPPTRIYVEPFAGAASVLLRRPRSSIEVLNDLDQDLVLLFKVVRDLELSRQLQELCRLTPYARGEWEGAWESTDDMLERCRRLLIRSWMSHGANGVTSRKHRAGFRKAALGRQGGTNPASGWQLWTEYMPQVTARLQGVIIENKPALEVMRYYDHQDTLFYVDPPYLCSERSRPDHCYKHEMSREQHVELAVALHGLRGAVVLSGYPSSLYADLYADWPSVERRAQKDGSSMTIETLWIKENKKHA